MFFRVAEPMGCARVCVCIYLLYDDLFIYREICYTHTYICYEESAHMIMEVKFQFCHLQAGARKVGAVILDQVLKTYGSASQ